MNIQLLALLVMLVSVVGISVGNCVRLRNEKLGNFMVWGLICSSGISLIILMKGALGTQ